MLTGILVLSLGVSSHIRIFNKRVKPNLKNRNELSVTVNSCFYLTIVHKSAQAFVYGSRKKNVMYGKPPLKTLTHRE